MNARSFFLSLLFVFVAACGDKPSIESTPPSPLPDANSDRLWILARASRVGDGRNCKDRYLKPDDPRYRGLTQQCDAWTRNYAEYLRINGLPTVEHQHLKDPSYWHWYVDKRSQISDCITAVGNLSLTATSAESAAHTRRRRECDPYADALYNQPGAPRQDLGIRYP